MRNEVGSALIPTERKLGVTTVSKQATDKTAKSISVSSVGSPLRISGFQRFRVGAINGCRPPTSLQFLRADPVSIL